MTKLRCVYKFILMPHLQVIIISHQNLGISYFWKTTISTNVILCFGSLTKQKRINHSVLGSEIMAFVDAFDMAYIIKHDLHLMTKSYIPLFMMTYSLFLFDILTKASFTTEKTLNNWPTNCAGLIQQTRNTRRCLRSFWIRYHRRTDNRKIILFDAFQTSNLNHLLEQWIVRSSKIKSVFKTKIVNLKTKRRVQRHPGSTHLRVTLMDYFRYHVI